MVFKRVKHVFHVIQVYHYLHNDTHEYTLDYTQVYNLITRVRGSLITVSISQD